MGRAPTTDEVEAAEQSLLGGGDRPALNTLVDEIAAKRLDGTAQIRPDAFSRKFDIYYRLMPHTRERPKEENQWGLDRDNCGAVRSNDAARTARILVQSLDQYQGEQYGQTDNGTPRAAPSVERFSAWTTRGQEKKRQKRIAETIRRWRSVIAPGLLRQIRQAIIPLEVQFRRQLAQRRVTEKRTAEAQRRQIAAVQTPTSSKSRPRN